MSGRRGRAVTLLEVLVATAILTTLGAALMVVLRGGLTVWRRSEARRETYEQAQAILLEMRDDFAAALPPRRGAEVGLSAVEGRLFFDPSTATLILVRTLAGESEHPVTGLAGNAIGADAALDLDADAAEARAERLRATGGAMEVAWSLGPGGVLYRGLRSPIGSPGSFFEPGAFGLAPAPGTPPAAGGAASSGPLLRPFATHVLYLEVRFWTQYTTGWSLADLCVRDPEPGEESGPLSYWDSTRSIEPPWDPEPREFTTFLAAGSTGDPRDDLMPPKVRVTLVLEEAPAARSSAFLARELTAQDDEVWLDDASRLSEEGGYLYVGGEWIRYDGVRGERAQVARDGRGVRGTQPAAHTLDQIVQLGRSFTAVFELSCVREDWGDDPARRNP